MIPASTQFRSSYHMAEAAEPAQPVDGVDTPQKAIFGTASLDVRKINDGIYTGRRGSYQRYDVGPSATDILLVH